MYLKTNFALDLCVVLTDHVLLYPSLCLTLKNSSSALGGHFLRYQEVSYT